MNHEFSLGTYSSRNDSETAATPKPTPAQVTGHQSSIPGACGTAYRQLNRLESVLSRYLNWSESDPQQSLLWTYVWGGKANESGQLQGLPEAFELFPP